MEDKNLLKEALEQIEQMSDPGSPETAIVRMKSIATEALKKFAEQPKQEANPAISDTELAQAGKDYSESYGEQLAFIAGWRAKEAAEKDTVFSEWQLCPKCLGNGTIHDDLPTMSTSPFKQCDVCFGAKVLAKPFKLPEQQEAQLGFKDTDKFFSDFDQLGNEQPKQEAKNTEELEIEQDFKELKYYLTDIYYHHINDVKDAGNLWIAFIDKFNAFKRKIIAGWRAKEASQQPKAMTKEDWNDIANGRDGVSQQEYDNAVNEIRQLQNQLKDAEESIWNTDRVCTNCGNVFRYGNNNKK